mmetsp:Transcript_129878/g.224541  ORF Transcript_129878/g.224541 Transcript_129878/m.224541 type:complete len:305 (+) Transcript_129878:1811-2725(+)
MHSVVRGPYTHIPAATMSRPVVPTIRLPGHTPKMVPTAKLQSTIDEPSSGSKQTAYPEPPYCTGTGFSSEHATSHTSQCSRASNRIRSANISTASCSSPKTFVSAVLFVEHCLTFVEIFRHASASADIRRWSPSLPLATARNSSRLPPTETGAPGAAGALQHTGVENGSARAAASVIGFVDLDGAVALANSSALQVARRRSLTPSCMKCSKRATSTCDPKHTCVRWSMPVITTSSADTHRPSQEDAPPAFSTSRPMGATSKDSRSLALVDGEITFVNTPFSFTNSWYTSGTIPPVYRSVYCSLL